MELLRFSELECHYGAREIFAGASASISEGERIALVGPNGAGKSSLLRLLAGVDEPSGGRVVRAKGARLGYLAQSAADATHATLQQLVDMALARADDAGWALANKMLRTMLNAFGFAASDYERPLREFSGGQRAKASLAYLLIDNPDYLILDEPTNHLDIATVRWLESFIAADKRAYLIVSHDRYFIDRVATRIWEIDRTRLRTYRAEQPAYTRYVLQREALLEEERRTYEQFVSERAKRRSTIADLRATRTSSDYSQVRSREKQLARFEASSLEVAPPSAGPAPIGVRLQAARRATDGFAFRVKALAKGYARTLFAGLTFDLQQGRRLGIVGANGSGKSTLLRILAGAEPADDGEVRLNPTVQIAYYAQNANDQLDERRSAFETVAASAAITAEEARALLGRMRISGAAADKPVGAFSGGERRRIMLARLMARQADLLLLDEPTNDLDIESREALESVLAEYEGALAIVSHDRYLLAKLTDRILWLEAGKWGILEGGYERYEAMERERSARELSSPSESRPKASRQTALKVRSGLEARIARTERAIGELDRRKAEIETSFAEPDTYQDHALLRRLRAELTQIADRSLIAVAEWQALVEEFERLAE